MTEEAWRPLWVETNEEIADYDALYDGVPPWMQTALWEWIKGSITTFRTFRTRR